MKLRTKAIEKWVKKEVDGAVAEFLLCPMTPKESTDLLAKVTIYKWDRNQRFESLDFYKFKTERIDRVIKEWKGIEDENGNPLECNRTNKELVYAYNRDLIDSLLDDSESIMEQHIRDAGVIEKNL